VESAEKFTLPDSTRLTKTLDKAAFSASFSWLSPAS
jgi:hypothetical protein